METLNTLLQRLALRGRAVDSARMLIPGTCTLLYYLRDIAKVRRATNCHAVIVDADNCIIVL